MRIDKFLNIVNITKRRAISEDMCKNGVVSVNGVVAKPSKIVKVSDIITIKFLTRQVNYEILKIPENKTIPKNSQCDFVRQF